MRGMWTILHTVTSAPDGVFGHSKFEHESPRPVEDGGARVVSVWSWRSCMGGYPCRLILKWFDERTHAVRLANYAQRLLPIQSSGTQHLSLHNSIEP